MSVSFVTAVTGDQQSNTTTANINFSGASVGDFALVEISRSNTSTASTVPTKWSLLASHSSTYAVFFYWKILEAGDIGSIQWVFGTSGKTIIQGVAYSGVDSSTPSYTKGVFETSSGQSLSLGSLSSSQPWLLVAASCYSTATKTYDLSSWSSPSWSERLDSGNTSPDHWQVFADTNGGWTSGSFAPNGTTAYISGASTYRGGIIVELKAATAATYGPGSIDPLGMNGMFGL